MGYGDEDLARIEEDMARRPSSGAITRLCRRLGIEEDDRRTVNLDDDWEYFYELLEKLADTVTREQLYEFLASYLSPGKIEEHLNHIEQLKRKTA